MELHNCGLENMKISDLALGIGFYDVWVFLWYPFYPLFLLFFFFVFQTQGQLRNRSAQSWKGFNLSPKDTLTGLICTHGFECGPSILQDGLLFPPTLLVV